MEVGGVNLIFELGWLRVVLESTEVALAELFLGVRLESLIQRRLLSFIVLSVDRCTSGLSK